MKILDCLEAGERETAAALMRKHLDAAAKLGIHAVVADSSQIGRKAS
jgi:DNA-binding FadR family transcriptional regulator